jgi:hypothetical protein
MKAARRGGYNLQSSVLSLQEKIKKVRLQATGKEKKK